MRSFISFSLLLACCYTRNVDSFPQILEDAGALDQSNQDPRLLADLDAQPDSVQAASLMREQVNTDDSTTNGAVINSLLAGVQRYPAHYPLEKWECAPPKNPYCCWTTLAYPEYPDWDDYKKRNLEARSTDIERCEDCEFDVFIVYR